MHVINRLSKPTEYTTPRINLNVNCGLWVMIMGQCEFISCKKIYHSCGGCWSWGRLRTCRGSGYMEISVPCSQFGCKAKTALKKSSLKKLNKIYKLSSFTSPTTFQVLSDHMWVMATSLGNADTKHYTKVYWRAPHRFCIFVQSAVLNTQHRMWSLYYLIHTYFFA